MVETVFKLPQKSYVVKCLNWRFTVKNVNPTDMPVAVCIAILIEKCVKKKKKGISKNRQ